MLICVVSRAEMLTGRHAWENGIDGLGGRTFREGLTLWPEALRNAGMEYGELVLNRDFRQAGLLALAGTGTVPQVFIDGVRIGGADELEGWLGCRRAA